MGMSEHEASTMSVIKALMDGVIDYAGLFPPSEVSMDTAVTNYAKYLRSEHASFLGRFVCPVARLDELTKEGAMLMPGTHATSGYRENADTIDAWRISGVLREDLPGALEKIYTFNEHHDDEANGLAMVDAIEMPVRTPDEIDGALEVLPEMIGAAFEIPQDIVMGGDPRGLIAALAGSGVLAKIRCGGVKPEMIPDSASVARFMLGCKRADVGFKCTAGLHHPIRKEYPLTYADDAPRGVMHGFVNMFFAGAATRKLKSIDEATIIAILDETDPAKFVFKDGTITWDTISISGSDMVVARESFITSFGSCSFTEPTADLKALGLL